MARPVLQIIIASTRPGRVGPAVAEWFRMRAEADDRFEIEVVDLLSIDLPLLDEPHHPRLGQYIHQHTKDWSAQVSRADAYVIVTPEYNYGYNAVIKNAIDYLHSEWHYKAVGFVSYGGVAAGTRAVQMLKQVLTTVKMVPVYESVNIPFIGQFLDHDGNVEPNGIMDNSADNMLEELHRWSEPLRSMRRAHGSDPTQSPASLLSNIA
jgi:NAD(P)H-dependent FMN reductase